jgi:hypothetical protein
VVLGVIAGGLRGGRSRRAGEEPEGVDGAGHIVTRHPNWFAGVGRLHVHQQVVVFFDPVGDLQQDERAFLRCQPSPRWLGLAGGRHRKIDVGDGAFGNLREHRLAAGVDHIEGAIGGARAELTIDELPGRWQVAIIEQRRRHIGTANGHGGGLVENGHSYYLRSGRRNLIHF